ncbi:MAG: hypothetical protein HOO90_00960 [Methylotenera sp.]|uniref:hypothetical protein n=1 Tax=Methylotenera sp. TaxID=2051956 RepID=UPI00184D82A8|nr:hypothetical protein [Methylotenera sp.]NOU24085.1 hypothetical protein [Methylotenera sp.]
MANPNKPKKLPETFEGGYSALPHSVQDNLSFTGATDKAKSLLFALIRQVNGKNNGHIHLAPQWLKKHGYTSSSIYVSRAELIDRALITQTRWGGLNNGPNLYAVTWLAISNFVGLDIDEDDFQRGAWARCKLPPTPRRAKPINKKLEKPHDDRNSVTTAIVSVSISPSTITVAENVLLLASSTTTTVNNVVNTNTYSKKPKRVVGVIGKSGIKKPIAQTPIAGGVAV